jgi:hypothetical protein
LITIEFATVYTEKEDFYCKCGEEECRGVVRAGDWKDEFMEKYDGYLTDYV